MTLRALFYIEQNYAFAILRPLQQQLLLAGSEVRWFVVGQSVNCDYFLDGESQLDTLQQVVEWNPDVVFVPGNYVTRLIPGLKVEIFHGFDSGKVNRRGRPYHLEIRHCFDLYCTHGKSSTEPFLELQKQYRTFEVCETGWPAVDPLFRAVDNNPYIDEADDRKTVLFCSTHSPRFSCAELIYEEVKRLSSTGRYRWLIQFHPMMARETVSKYRQLNSDSVRFVETDNVLPLLQAADVMLCDTSSVLLMFLVQQKPVVTFNNHNPGPHLLNVTQIEDIEAALDQALRFPEGLSSAIKQYSDDLHPYRDGRSAERVINAVERAMNTDMIAGLKRKPANWWREYKERKKIRR